MFDDRGSLVPTVNVFENRQIRHVILDGEPIWVGKDVCEALGISKHRDAIAHLDSDERESIAVDTPGGKQSMAGVKEAGVWSLILISRSPKMKSFQRWLTHEVIPKIRKTGSYSFDHMVPRSLPDALRAFAREVEAREAAEERVKELEPKAQYVDDFVAVSDDCLTIRAVAAQLNVKERWLRDVLVEKGWIYKLPIGKRFSASKQKLVDEYEWRPYSDKKQLFQLVPQHNVPRYHNNQVRHTLYVNPGGLQAIQRLVEQAQSTTIVVGAA